MVKTRVMKPEAALKAIRAALRVWTEDGTAEGEALIRIVQIVEKAGFPVWDGSPADVGEEDLEAEATADGSRSRGVRALRALG